MLALAACGGSESGASGGDSGDSIGYSNRGLDNPFQAAAVKRVAAEAEAQGANVLPVVNANNDPAKQNEDINTLLTRGVKGLIVNPIDADAIVPAIGKANAAGVPVVTVDTPANGGKVAMQVTSDNYGAGAAACDALAAAVGEKGTVLNLQGDLAGKPGLDRSNGFTECMAKKYPNIQVVSKPMNWKPDKCAEVSRTVLSTTQIDGVFSAGTLICLGPVTTVLKSLNRFAPVGDPKHVPFVGIDGAPDELDAIRDGSVDAVISQPLDQFAKYAIYWVTKAMKKEAIGPGPTDHDSTVEEVNGILTDHLPVTTVTKKNVDDPALWGNQ
jgi:ribose transport system substrate-binding protein